MWAIPLVLLIVGCSSLSIRKSDSNLPIAVEPVGWASLHASAWESSDHLYVSGSLRRPFGLHYPRGAAMRVELLGANGEVISTAEDQLPPTSPRRIASGRAPVSFVVKFPLEETRGAVRIRVRVRDKGEAP